MVVARRSGFSAGECFCLANAHAPGPLTGQSAACGFPQSGRLEFVSATHRGHYTHAEGLWVQRMRPYKHLTARSPFF